MEQMKGIKSLFIISMLLLHFDSRSAEIKHLQKDSSHHSIAWQRHLFTDTVKVGRFNARITETFNESDKAKLIEALQFLEDLIVQNEFKSRVEKNSFYKFRGSKLKLRYDQFGKYSSDKKTKVSRSSIYQMIIQGNDALGDENDGVIDLFLELRDYRPKIRASTGKGMISLNRDHVWRDESFQCLASTILHEYMHVLGFKHIFNSPKLRWWVRQKRDVAYDITRVVKHFARKETEDC